MSIVNYSDSEEESQIVVPALPKEFEKPQHPNDDPSLHDGRIRVIPHMEGSLPVHVYLDVCLPDDLKDLVSSWQNQWKSIDSSLVLYPLDEPLHISLSKSWTLRRTQTKSFLQACEQEIKRLNMSSITLTLVKFSTYVNQDKSRSFLALDVGSGFQEIQLLMSAMDKVGQRFGLSSFHSPPLFHASLMWCMGDKMTELQYPTRDELKPLMSRPLLANRVTCKLASNITQWKL